MSDALIDGLAGAGGGIIARIITYPLQTVATRHQTERDLKKERRSIGTLEQIFQLVKQEGRERLYGDWRPVSITGGHSCISGEKKAGLSAVKQIKKGIGNGTVGMLASLWVAALSGCINVLIITPIWVVVMRMQVSA